MLNSLFLLSRPLKNRSANPSTVYFRNEYTNPRPITEKRSSSAHGSKRNRKYESNVRGS